MQFHLQGEICSLLIFNEHIYIKNGAQVGPASRGGTVMTSAPARCDMSQPMRFCNERTRSRGSTLPDDYLRQRGRARLLSMCLRLHTRCEATSALRWSHCSASALYCVASPFHSFVTTVPVLTS